MSEKIITVSRNDFDNMTHPSCIFNIPFTFTDREMAEHDESLIQVIPYVALRNDGKVLSYQRQAGDNRLITKHSVGFGGHPNQEWDYTEGKSLWCVVKSAAVREIREELGIPITPAQLIYLGDITLDVTEVDRLHTGIVFECWVNDLLANNIAAEEGITGLSWIDVLDPDEYSRSEYENWSQYYVEEYYGTM